MGQDAGMDASPSWQDLKDERDALRADKRMAEWRDQRWRTQILAKECKKLKAERDALAAFRSAVCGWREADWPEGFCRRTAELLAEHGRQAEDATEAGRKG